MYATDLIPHILHCNGLVKTQLGFLVYLVDREWTQRTGQSLTGFTYRKSRNRPQAEEYSDALRDLEDSNAVTVFEGTNQFGTAYKLYEAVLPPRHAVPPDVYVTVKKVMTDFGSKWTGTLAEHVSETPPVVQAREQEELDLSL